MLKYAGKKRERETNMIKSRSVTKYDLIMNSPNLHMTFLSVLSLYTFLLITFFNALTKPWR